MVLLGATWGPCFIGYNMGKEDTRAPKWRWREPLKEGSFCLDSVHFFCVSLNMTGGA
jgi:hypothetical protein